MVNDKKDIKKKESAEETNSTKEEKRQKTLNVYYATYGIIFWDENKNIITAIHENDADYRSEYHDVLFKHFGIKVKCHEKKPRWLNKKIT